MCTFIKHIHSCHGLPGLRNSQHQRFIWIVKLTNSFQRDNLLHPFLFFFNLFFKLYFWVKQHIVNWYICWTLSCHSCFFSYLPATSLSHSLFRPWSSMPLNCSAVNTWKSRELLAGLKWMCGVLAWGLKQLCLEGRELCFHLACQEIAMLWIHGKYWWQLWWEQESSEEIKETWSW